MHDERDEQGCAVAVRNGRARERQMTLRAGSIAIRAPRVYDHRPGCPFHKSDPTSVCTPLPRRGRSLPALYLPGLSTGDFSEGLAALVGPAGAALSATTITHLLQGWQEEYAAWRQRPLAATDYVYVWADGLCFNVRLEVPSCLSGAHWRAHER